MFVYEKPKQRKSKKPELGFWDRHSTNFMQYICPPLVNLPADVFTGFPDSEKVLPEET